MRILYLDCTGGVTARALANGLLALNGDTAAVLDRLAEQGLEGLRWDAESGLEVSGLDADRDLALRAREVMDQAECGEEELGWAAACLALEAELGAEKVIASPVDLGAPLSPRAARALQGKPVTAGVGARTSGLGAALVAALADDFGALPVMTLRGCGEGRGDGACVRALLGEREEARPLIVELSASIDDMTPEELGFAQERFFAAGALEVYTVPLNMKKSRPGALLCVTCAETRKEDMLREIFRHTTTIGVRANYSERFAMRRVTETVATPLGAVRLKVADGYGVRREKWEYEDVARLARETGRSVGETRALLDAAKNGGRSKV